MLAFFIGSCWKTWSYNRNSYLRSHKITCASKQFHLPVSLFLLHIQKVHLHHEKKNKSQRVQPTWGHHQRSASSSRYSPDPSFKHDWSTFNNSSTASTSTMNTSTAILLHTTLADAILMGLFLQASPTSVLFCGTFMNSIWCKVSKRSSNIFVSSGGSSKDDIQLL